jgi:hypothetical protein
MREQRQSRGYRLLGITLPLAAMVFALFVDLTLHGHGRRGRCGRHGHAVLQDATPPAMSLEDALQALERKCSNSAAVTACLPSRFGITMAAEMAVFEANRASLEEWWLADLAVGDVPGRHGDHIAAYGLAWLRSERALPELRRRYVADRHAEFLAWGEQPDDPEDVYATGQFPHHVAFAAAIEHIARRPLRHVVKLSDEDRGQLRLDTHDCVTSFAAHWVLHELDGVPFPSAGATIASFEHCGFGALGR